MGPERADYAERVFNSVSFPESREVPLLARSIFPVLALLLGLGVVFGSTLVPTAAATPAGFQPALTASALFFQNPVADANPDAWTLPPQSSGGPRGGPPLGTSVFPATPGEFCSVEKGTANPSCSVNSVGARCTARVDDGPFCSVFSTKLPQTSGSCSTFGDRAACSVLHPAVDPPTALSGCSVLGNGEPGGSRCSALGGGRKEGCSVENPATIPSACTTFGDNATCSVLNEGANRRSFCSAFFAGGQQTCSTHDGFGPVPGSSSCSVISGGYGVCTALKQAPAATCSAHTGVGVPPGGGLGHCSVIGGAAGSLCRQP